MPIDPTTCGNTNTAAAQTQTPTDARPATVPISRVAATYHTICTVSPRCHTVTEVHSHEGTHGRDEVEMAGSSMACKGQGFNPLSSTTA